MKAAVGDRVIVASNVLDRPVRDGRIIEVRGADGMPPYVVEWADTGKTSLFFPGVDTQVQHFEGGDHEPAQAQEQELAPDAARQERRVKTWTVRVDLFESGDETTAHAVLTSDSPSHLDAQGRARRAPSDPEVPEIGDEVAAARALRLLADRLIESASIDLEAVTGKRVSLQG